MRCHWLVVLAAIQLITTRVAADVPKEGGGVAEAAVRQEEVSFPAVVDHIRKAVASGAWQKEGWSDSLIDGAIKEWVHQAAQQTGQPRPDLPAGLAGLRAAQGNQGKQSRVLYLGADQASFSFIDKSVILVDGNVTISFAWDCVVVARGAVRISHGDRNVVMAGRYIHVSHDGNHKQGQMQGSLLMSGDVLNVSHASGSVCAAPTMIRIGHANGVTFVDSPIVDAGAGLAAPNRKIAGPKLRGAPAVARNPLDGKIQVVGASKGNDAGAGAMAVIKHDGAELVVRPGEQIKDAAGNVIGGLEAWRLSFVSDDYALFSTDHLDSGFFLGGK
jgi:hypothetical protein